jgi:outer membrane immunogenic protein
MPSKIPRNFPADNQVRVRENLMRKFLAISVALGALFTAGQASADATYGPEPSYNWGGMYGGITAGYGATEQDWRANGVVHDTDGVMLGGTLGVNMDTGNWVLGLEADYAWVDADDSSVTGACAGATTCTSEMTAFGTFRARVGYDFGSTERGMLLYGTAGAAAVDVDYAVATIGSDSEINLGWVAGAGLEMALGEKMSAKIEYLHYDTQGSARVGIPFSPEATGDVARLGLNYRF